MTKHGGDVDKAFAEAEHIVRLRIASPRLVALALEPRGVLAKPEPTGDLTVWLSTQSPHWCVRILPPPSAFLSIEYA